MESPFTMVVLIVLICVAGSIVRAKMGLPERTRRRDRQATAGYPEADPALREENARLHEELRALKSRVATLERIATDSSTSLDREIEALRNRP